MWFSEFWNLKVPLSSTYILQFPRVPLQMLQGIWRVLCMCVMLDIREYVLSSSHIISESKLIGSYFVIILIWIPDFFKKSQVWIWIYQFRLYIYVYILQERHEPPPNFLPQWNSPIFGGEFGHREVGRTMDLCTCGRSWLGLLGFLVNASVFSWQWKRCRNGVSTYDIVSVLLVLVRMSPSRALGWVIGSESSSRCFYLGSRWS
jgi:hypothetical protein